MTITFHTVWIPVIITVVMLALPFILLYKERKGEWVYLVYAFYLVPCLFVSLLSWIVYGLFK